VFAEIADGMAIDVLRARFVSRIYQAALDGPGAGEAALIEAEGLLEEAREVVARRRASFWWPDGERLVDGGDQNATIYQFGYLYMADTLCYWDRERGEAALVVRADTTPLPPCL
jgi:hypothetical protein